MQIELKNVKLMPSLSEETNAFTATLYIDGQKAGYAENTGKGGPTDIRPLNEEGRRLIEQAEEYCKKLPPETYTSAGESWQVAMDLELYIDNIVDRKIAEAGLREMHRKMEKDMAKGIVFGDPQNQYRVLPLPRPLDTILGKPVLEAALRTAILRTVVPQMEDGDKILNNNLPKEFLRSLGLPEEKIAPFTKPGDAPPSQDLGGRGRKAR